MTNETNIPRTKSPAIFTDEYYLAEYDRLIQAGTLPEAPYTGLQQPMTQAAAALQRARQVVRTSDMLEDIACEPETCITADGLASPHESAAMLVAQARVLDDSVFNREGGSREGGRTYPPLSNNPAPHQSFLNPFRGKLILRHNKHILFSDVQRFSQTQKAFPP